MSEKSWQHMLHGHPEMAALEPAIRRTVEDPDVVVRSPQRALYPVGGRRVACRFDPSLRRSRPYVYVPIEYSPAGSWIPSAYLDRLPPTGEVLFVRLVTDR